jgi:hypothetical protein
MDTVEGSLELFYLCALMEFGEILDPFTYNREKDGDTSQYWMNTIYARGCAQNILKWWHSMF